MSGRGLRGEVPALNCTFEMPDAPRLLSNLSECWRRVVGAVRHGPGSEDILEAAAEGRWDSVLK